MDWKLPFDSGGEAPGPHPLCLLRQDVRMLSTDFDNIDAWRIFFATEDNNQLSAKDDMKFPNSAGRDL